MKSATPKSNGPLISVVMPVYNASTYLAESVTSILAQTYSHWELIIVDDGSTDESPAQIRDFAARDARIAPMFRTHGGRARAINAGVAASRGEIIARMDADDIALPARFAVQADWMRQAGVDVCGSCVKKFGADEGLIWFPETHEAICHEMLFRCGLLHPTVMLRAEIAKAQPYDEQAAAEDYELWTRLAPHYRMGNVPQVLLKYRSHAQQSHVVESAAFRADLRRFGYRYFVALFPRLTAADYAPLAAIAENKPFSCLADLERAGWWLVRLAQLRDALLRQRMAIRWKAACHASSALGLGCYRLYRHIAPDFGIPMDAVREESRALWLACALRLRPGSGLDKALRTLKQQSNRARRSRRSIPYDARRNRQ